MRWTCPKCGKKLEISNEQLIANDGVIICPQCLLQAHQPIPTARIAAKYDQADAVTTPPKRTQSTTPPPPKARMKQAKTSYRYTGIGGSNNDNTHPTSPKKKSTKKKSKKKKGQQEISAWGCMGRTVIFTLVLFAAYIFFGLLLEALQ